MKNVVCSSSVSALATLSNVNLYHYVCRERERYMIEKEEGFFLFLIAKLYQSS